MQMLKKALAGKKPKRKNIKKQEPLSDKCATTFHKKQKKGEGGLKNIYSKITGRKTNTVITNYNPQNKKRSHKKKTPSSEINRLLQMIKHLNQYPQKH